jgi:hypothetical protein
VKSGLVWYAAYGSNLNRQRFDCYIKGGRPTGAKRNYLGCRDTSAPKSDRPGELPGALVFGKESLNWTGCGVAFLNSSKTDETAKARLYLVTHEQLEDIVAQENHRPVGVVTLPGLPVGSVHDLQDGFYPLVIGLADVDGHVVVTITDELKEHTKPSPAYLRHIAQGLRESHNMSDTQIVDYLLGKRGIEGLLEEAEITDAVRGP